MEEYFFTNILSYFYSTKLVGLNPLVKKDLANNSSLNRCKDKDRKRNKYKIKDKRADREDDRKTYQEHLQKDIANVLGC